MHNMQSNHTLQISGRSNLTYMASSSLDVSFGCWKKNENMLKMKGCKKNVNEVKQISSYPNLSGPHISGTGLVHGAFLKGRPTHKMIMLGNQV